MSVTVELLDAMLAPGAPAGGQQQQPPPAEALYRSVPLQKRVLELASLLARLNGADAADVNNANAGGRAMLAAVLLRRDLGALAGNEAMTGIKQEQAVGLMGEVAEPLLSLFLRDGSSSRGCRRQIGHCVAELCGSLSLVSPENGKEWTRSVLGRIEPGCAAGDEMHLRLLSDVAERSPAALWSVGSAESFAPLLRGRSSSLEQLEASVGALCQVGIAYERAKRVASARGGGGDAERALLLAQFPEACTDVDPNSPPARLGGLLLPSMLEALVAFSANAQPSQLDALSKCMSYLSACSELCPSLLAGEEAALSALARACMSIARIADGREDEDVVFLRLSSLDVLATITAVPSVRRSVAKPASSPSPRFVGESFEGGRSPLLQFLVCGDDNGSGGSDWRGVLHLCAELAAAGVDDDEGGWAAEPATVHDSESSWEDDRAALHAESLLECFVENLGGAVILPVIFAMVDGLLASDSWKGRRAVLSILERCLAAAPVSFAPHVPATVDVALKLIGTASPRVQYQALQLLGSLCCANSVEVEGQGRGQQIIVRENYGGQILEAASRLIASPCTRVASHACLMVVSYCRGGNGNENCAIPIEKGLVVPFIGGLLDALRSGPLSANLSDPNAVSEGSLTVLIRAIGAVACLADAAGEDFLPHYGVVAGLKACALFGLQRSGDGAVGLAPGVRNTHEMAALRGAAIEAASIVGRAVSGPEGENVAMYADDASEIMTVAATLLNGVAAEIIPADQLLAACARIASVMRGQYVQFMPSVLPHILGRAAEKLEVSVTDDDDASPGGASDDDGVEGYTVSIPGMGSKRVRINTTQLEEKAQSARALYEHASALSGEFGPFVGASAEAFLPLVRCEYSGDVRSTSAQALCQVFKSACLFAAANDASNNPNGQSQRLLPALVRALAEQLTNEGEDDDVEDRHAIADALSEVMWDAYEHKAANGQRVAQIAVVDAREIVRRLMSLISECLVRRSTLLSEMADYSFDGDQIARCEERAQAESEYLTHLMDSVGYLLKSLGDDFAPIFAESVAEPLGQILASVDVRARFTAVCLFDDCVEHCGSQAANTYAPALLQGIQEALNDADVDAELKRAAVYGIAQVSRHAPQCITPAVGKDLLIKVYNIAREVETTAKGEMEHAMLVENAVSAMASLALLQNSPLFDSVSDKGAMTATFLRGLPLEEDFDEAQVCHAGLCDLVESNSINVQTEFAILIRIVGKVLALVSEGESVATQEAIPRLMGIIDKIQQSVDGNSIQTAFSALEPDVQQALVAAM